MPQSKSGPSLERLRELVIYDPATGVFTNRIDRNNRFKAGDAAGSLGEHGYVRIRVDVQRYFAHRLVWLYVHGVWPIAEIDHINGDRSDNRVTNLRLATRSQNHGNTKRARNNKSGFKGVYFNRKTGRWVAQIMVDSKRRRLGLFDTPEAAHAAYVAYAMQSRGSFARAA